MRTTFAVALLELRRRRAVVLAALVVGVMSLAAPLVPSLRAEQRHGLRGLVAVWLGVVLLVPLSLALGSSTLAGDLRARRAGFFLARPIPAWAVFAGKL